MEDLRQEWHSEVKNLVKAYAATRAKLWSFEVEKKLSLGTVRESFFQAVSNSSWANYGYLVAAEIDKKADKELRILCSLHGIGLIKLNVDNPVDSQIIIPAKEKSEVDRATCDRLTKVSTDFKDFVSLVWQFHRTGDPRPKDWDYYPGE